MVLRCELLLLVLSFLLDIYSLNDTIILRGSDTVKCDNCGNSFKNSLICPLCGHRQGKVNRCSVCETVVYYGQSNCSNCGNPTKYSKKEDINKEYHMTNKQDYSKHNSTTHVYQTQEMYDYKESNNDAKKRYEEARNKLTGYKIKPVQPNLALEKKSLIVIIIAVIAVLSSVFISPFGEDKLDVEMVQLDSMTIAGDNSDLMMAGNFQQGGFTYLSNDDLYLGCNYYLDKRDRSLSNISDINFETDGFDWYIYVEDDYIYYSDYGIYKRYDVNSETIVDLFEGESVLPIKNHRFLYTYEMGLYLYENGVSKLVDSHDIYNFAFDFKTELIYFEQSGIIRAIDLNGVFKGEYEFYVSNVLYVNDGVIYYNDIEGIKSFDTKENSFRTYVEESDIYNFIVTDKGIVYSNSENDLYYYYFNDELYIIGMDVFEFNVVGDKVIYNSENGWYISDGHDAVSEFLE